MPDQAQMFESLAWTTGERAILGMAPEASTAQWGEKKLMVVDGPYEGSSWRISAAPYIQGILDIIDQPWVRLAVFIAASQVGKTWGLIYLHWARWAVEDPSPSLLMMADYNSAKLVSLNRLQPMVEQSPGLLPFASPAKEDMTTSRIALINGAVLDLGWAGSPATASTFSRKRVYLDELNLYSEQIGKETGAVGLARARVAQYPNDSKIIAPTTCTYPNAPGWKAYQTLPEEYYDCLVPCPHCGYKQKMEWERIRWPEGLTDWKRIDRERLAWYECEKCKGLWTDAMRNEAVQDYEFRPLKGIKEPANVGFRLPAWYSPQVSFSKCAAAHLKAEETGDREDKMYFVNHLKAEPYSDEKVERDWQEVLEAAKSSGYARGEIPDWAVALVAGIDAQRKDMAYITLFAVGAPPRPRMHMFLESQLAEWEHARDVVVDGTFQRDLQVNFALMDAGDGPNYWPIIEWCRDKKPIYPSKGHPKGATIWWVKKLEQFPDGRRIPGGQNLYNLQVNLAKFAVSNAMATAPGLPGALTFHSEISKDFARQICAEFVNDKGAWECRSGVANHFWDCVVYAFCAAKIIEPLLPAKADPQPKPQVRPESRENRPGRAPGWYQSRRY